MIEKKPNGASSGKAKNLVLIHGWGFDGQIWNDFIPHIKDQWHVTNINMPGYGNQKNSAKSNSCEADINRIVSLLSPKIPEGATILAWSLGGHLATRIACIRKDIKALIFIASSPCFLNKSDWQHGIDPVDFDQLAERVVENKAKALQVFSGLVAIGDSRPRAAISKLIERVEANVPETEALMAGLDILRREDQRALVTGLRCPAGMIFGEKDALVKRSTGKAVQSIRPDINTIEIASTGHAPFLTRPHETAAALTKLTGNLYLNHDC